MGPLHEICIPYGGGCAYCAQWHDCRQWLSKRSVRGEVPSPCGRFFIMLFFLRRDPHNAIVTLRYDTNDNYNYIRIPIINNRYRFHSQEQETGVSVSKKTAVRRHVPPRTRPRIPCGAEKHVENVENFRRGKACGKHRTKEKTPLLMRSHQKR